MNVVHVIGNGFDIAQGLNTRYSDFYNFLKTQDPSNELDKLMIQQLTTEKVELWKDLEIELGRFSINASHEEDYSMFLLGLLERLKTYLLKQQDSLVLSKEIKDKIVSDFMSPETYLKVNERIELQSYYGIFSQPHIYNLLTFNYTNTLEQIGFNNAKNFIIDNQTGRWRSDKIYHIHGTLESTMLMGVDNILQISNLWLRESEMIKDIMVKPISNERLGDMTDSTAKNLIDNANLITIMGMSFGDTDKTWWERIGDRLINGGNIKVILFCYLPNINFQGNYRLMKPQKERELKKQFIKTCGIKDEFIESIENKVFVSINSHFLQPK